MNVGVVGLGLIGGSIAKAYSGDGETAHRVFGCDTDNIILDYAIMSGAVSEKLTESNIALCDVLFLCVFPKSAAEYLEKNAGYISKGAVVIDCCGTKRGICDAGFRIAKEHGFTFVGGHPMAGTHNSGFKYSRADMFLGAPMVIVPPVFDDMEFLDRIKKLLKPLGFGFISVTTAENHDKTIAFTSQMAHIVSNAYIKSPQAKVHKGFSAGSYKDLTRVAWLNPDMWTELFMENRDFLLSELELFIGNLTQYRDALKDADPELMRRLLDEGRNIKGEIDG